MPLQSHPYLRICLSPSIHPTCSCIASRAPGTNERRNPREPDGPRWSCPSTRANLEAKRDEPIAMSRCILAGLLSRNIFSFSNSLEFPRVRVDRQGLICPSVHSRVSPHSEIPDAVITRAALRACVPSPGFRLRSAGGRAVTSTGYPTCTREPNRCNICKGLHEGNE